MKRFLEAEFDKILKEIAKPEVVEELSQLKQLPSFEYLYSPDLNQYVIPKSESRPKKKFYFYGESSDGEIGFKKDSIRK